MGEDYYQRLKEKIKNLNTLRPVGRVKQVIGLVIEGEGPPAKFNEICKIKISKDKEVLAEVVGFRENRILLMPIGEIDGIAPEQPIEATGRPLSVKVSPALIGRIVNGIGTPIDDLPDNIDGELISIFNQPPPPLKRPRITQILQTGVRAIDTLLTIGKGQRIGIFSGSGIGKSTLLGMIARNTKADINVIALIGERGREVKEFIERNLQEEGLKRSVVVVATSDEPPLLRLRGAFVATTIAEYFRDKGYDVMFMMDSITRFARAQREIGLSIGEPPTTKGFTPSVFAILPKLLERTGTSDKGTITSIYTILVDADDINEPISDNVRAILDGHIVLSRELADKGHYPAIDILSSVSRVMIDIVDEETYELSLKVREVLAIIKEHQDLINIGAYVKGSNEKIDYALTKINKINDILKQGIFERTDYQSSIEKLKNVFSDSVNGHA